MRILSSKLCDIGLKRRTNQDSVICRDDLGLFAVADGMGGHAAGEVASATAVLTVRTMIEQAQVCDGTVPENDPDASLLSHLLTTAVESANDAIRNVAAANPDYSGMGTTFSGMVVRGSQIGIAHVGDSRIYRLRNRVFEVITNDHSLVNEQLQKKLITPEEAKHHMWRNIITRALGNKPSVKIDSQEQQALAGDKYLICSDGLTNMVDDETLAEALITMNENLSETCEDLVRKAKNAGGDDNISVVIVSITE